MDEMMLKILKKEFGKHFWNQIKMINSYKELPKEFRNPHVFGPGFWDHYSKLGQFFYVSVPPKKYLILLPSGVKNPLGEDEPLRVSDEVGRVINPFEVEGQLRIAYMGLKLEDLLNYYKNHRVSKFKKIDESDIQRLVGKIISEQETTKKTISKKELVQLNIDKLRKKIKELQTKLDSYEKQLKSIR